METSVRCKTGNGVGQHVPTGAHQSRNSEALITERTESHRLLLYQTSLTEVKQQSPGVGKHDPFSQQSIPHRMWRGNSMDPPTQTHVSKRLADAQDLLSRPPS